MFGGPYSLSGMNISPCSPSALTVGFMVKKNIHLMIAK